LPLHLAGARYSQQSGNRDLAFRAAASETDFAPLHGAPQRAFRRVIGRLHTFLIEKREESFEMRQQCRGQIAHILVAAVGVAVGEFEKLFLQWNGFEDQLLPIDGTVPCARSVAKAMPKAEKARVQCQQIAAEPLRIGCFGDFQRSQDIAFKMRPAELCGSLVVLQVRRTTVAAEDSRKRRPSNWISTSAPRESAIL